MKSDLKSSPPTKGMTFHPKPMNLGFIVMGYDGDPSKIKTTLKSIVRWYDDAKAVVVLPEANKGDYQGAKVGGKSITSLINAGMENPPADWNVMLFAGVHVKERLDMRYSTFMEGTHDIFFPLIWGKFNFLDAPLNGLTIHKDTFKKVGPFADDNSLEICKMMWFLDATDKGCLFKAVAGTRMA